MSHSLELSTHACWPGLNGLRVFSDSIFALRIRQKIDNRSELGLLSIMNCGCGTEHIIRKCQILHVQGAPSTHPTRDLASAF